MSLPVFYSSFFVLPPYWTVHFCLFPSTRKYQYRPEQERPLSMSCFRFARGNWQPRQNDQFSTHTRSFSVAHNPALSVPQKFGYNKESKSFIKRQSKKATNTGTDGYATRPSVPRQSESTPIPVVPKKMDREASRHTGLNSS